MQTTKVTIENLAKVVTVSIISIESLTKLFIRSLQTLLGLEKTTNHAELVTVYVVVQQRRQILTRTTMTTKTKISYQVVQIYRLSTIKVEWNITQICMTSP